MAIGSQAARNRVVAVKATGIGPEPKHSRVILRNVDNHGFCSNSERYTHELPGLTIKPVYPVIISQPERASRILQNRIYKIYAQAVWIIRLVFEHLKRRLIWREVIRSHRVQTGPYVSLTILKKRDHPIFADTVRVTRVTVKTSEATLIAVELQQPQSSRAQPQIAVAILDHVTNAAIRVRGRLLLIETVLR